MLDVQAALTAAKIPGYRDAFRPTPGRKDPPDVYCVYQTTEIPTNYADDEAQDTLLRVQMYLYGINNPQASQAAVEAAMEAEDFDLMRKRDDYEPNTGAYLVLSEWQGLD